MICHGFLHGRGRCVLARIPAALRFDRQLTRLGEGARLGRHGGLGPRRLLGLGRLEGAQRAPELGERAAAIAQEGVERARAVAIADQGVPETPARKAVLGEQFCFEPLGALEPPGRGDDPPREHGLESAPSGASSSSSAASSAANSAPLSPGNTTCFFERRPCLSAFCAERALPSEVFGPCDIAPLRRLASARAGLKSAASVAMVCGAAAPGSALGLDMAGFLADGGAA
jgi:hypothetical protein